MKFHSLFSFAGLILCFGLLSRACTPPASEDGKTYTKDCFEDRKTQEEISQLAGIVAKVGQEYVLLKAGEENTRYKPCNLEKEFEIDQLKVRFSGKVKEIFPNERWPATPFVLTAIRKDGGSE